MSQMFTLRRSDFMEVCMSLSISCRDWLRHSVSGSAYLSFLHVIINKLQGLAKAQCKWLHLHSCHFCMSFCMVQQPWRQPYSQYCACDVVKTCTVFVIFLSVSVVYHRQNTKTVLCVHIYSVQFVRCKL